MKRRFLLALCSVIALLAASPGFASTVIDRYLAEPPGTERDVTYYFGPYHIPAGQDLNRVTIDLPLHDGFYTAIAPNLVDAVTGEEPPHQVAHIHHAHWFRITNNGEEERYRYSDYADYTDPLMGLSWVFGTGEEKTQGSLNDRAAAEPGGPRYGVYIDGKQPQGLIFMVHNKTSRPLNVNILLEVSFVNGTRDQIRNATPGCPGASAGTRCAAGADFHVLTGKLWGKTFDVPREPSGDGVYNYPVDAGIPEGRTFTAGWNSTIIAGAGHLHPLGKEVIIANLGPARCGLTDTDGDGLPGTTIFHSRKMERVPEATPFTEDYQMGATRPGFRAPVHMGDRIAQFGIYRNDLNATYEAMSYAGVYVDKLQPPAPLSGTAADCTAANFSSRLIDDQLGDPREGMLNHAWEGSPDELCDVPAAGYTRSCETAEKPWPQRQLTQVVHIAGFLNLPGDQSTTGPARILPQVKQGDSITFINEDLAIGVRHSVTSCPWPCNGKYVANYPLPDGTFESHVLGNIDQIDGAPFKASWSTPKNLPVGLYSYFCRIHPTMRGAFEVVPA